MKKYLQSVIVPYGFTLGVISMLITVLIYALNLELFTKWYVTLINFVIVLLIGIMAVKKVKAIDLEPYFSFKSAFSAFFFTVLLGSLISIVFTGILFNFVDSEAAKYVQEMTLEASRELMEKFGAQQEQIDAAIAKQEGNNPFGWKNIFMGFAFSIVLYAILSLIIAAIFKEKDPIRA